ncbi:MAG TPA: hypothetical protein DEO84_06355 [candidate division Zixibacteria bacterium]|nr:hypothetical protein [candidate division Zixibacteria bacterium]HBZ00928.1 hypothetical protein [candidate division Zixibacteria bacterium]
MSRKPKIFRIKYPIRLVIILGGISLIFCGHPTPILLNNGDQVCSWSQGGGGAERAGYAKTSVDGQPRILWKQTLESPLIVEPTTALGYIFVPTTKNKIAILSFDDGRSFGEVKFEGPISNPCSLLDSLIVVNEDGHRMVVYNWVTNNRIWQVELEGAYWEPLIYQKRVYWQDGTGIFHCYDLQEGKRVWAKKLEYNLISEAVASNSDLILAGTGPIIERLSAKDGNSLWRVNMEARSRNSPVIVGDTVLYCNIAGRIGALSMFDGSKIWESDAGPDIISPLATDGQGIYAGTNNGRLIKLNFDSGKIDWQLDIGSPVKAGATIFGDIVVFVSLNHKAYFVDKNDGTIKTEFETRGMLSARPIACSNRILIAGEDKNLYCFQVTEE